MRVSHCYFSMEIGGVEQNLLRTLPQFLSDSRLDHELVLTNKSGALHDRLPSDLPVRTPSKQRLFSDLYEIYSNTDIMHLYSVNENPIHRLSGYLANARIVDNPRNLTPVPNANRVNRVSCASRAIADLQDCPDRLTIIPNGIEVNENNPPTYEKFSDDCELTFVEIGRSDKERTHKAEDFMPVLKQSNPGVVCHVIGRDGENRDGIRYHGSVEDPSGLYKDAHFLTHFVETEPFGMTVLESYKYGVIPVASGDGGIRDLIDHTSTGFLLESPNKGEVIQQLRVIAERYSEDPRFWVPMAENGFEKLHGNYSLKQYSKQYIDLYDSVSGVNSDRFPRRTWSDEFNSYFAKLTMNGEKFQNEIPKFPELPGEFERDVGRLIECSEILQTSPNQTLNILSEVETDEFRDHFEIWEMRAHAHQLLDQYSKSIECAEKAMDHEPNLPDPYFIVADAYLNRNEIEKALEVLHSFQNRNPHYQPIRETIRKITPLRS